MASITIPSQSVTIPAQTVSIPVAEIVYQNSWTGQTAGLSSTTLFTPSSDGICRVTVAGKMVIGATLNINVDSVPAGQQLYEFQNQGTITVSPSGSAGVTFTYGMSNDIFIQASTPINISTSLSGSTTYDLYVTVEQLQ